MQSVLNGFIGAGLFRRINYPGAPIEFVDSRTLDGIRASGEIDRTLDLYRKVKKEQSSGAGRGKTDAEQRNAIARRIARL